MKQMTSCTIFALMIVFVGSIPYAADLKQFDSGWEGKPEWKVSLIQREDYFFNKTKFNNWVTIIWRKDEDKIPANLPEGFYYHGTLVFQPEEQEEISIPLRIQYTRQTKERLLNSPEVLTLHSEVWFLYLNEFIFEMHFDEIKPLSKDAKLERSITIYAYEQPLEWKLDSYAVKEKNLWVSEFNPIQLNQYQIAINSRPHSTQDKKHTDVLLVKDLKTNEEWVEPIKKHLQMNFGRFDIEVRFIQFIEHTRTAGLIVNASPDESVVGAKACVEKFSVSKDDTYGEVLQQLADEYGFSVEWKAVENHPESIEYAKNTDIRADYSSLVLTDLLVEKLINLLLDVEDKYKQIGYEWKDNTHLVVWSKGYENRLREIERREKYDRAKEAFLHENELMRGVYNLKDISPTVAQALIKNELHIYEIYYDTDSGDEPKFDMVERETTEHPSSNTVKFIEETAIADEKANVLFVTALPSTHEKIENILEEMLTYVRHYKQKVSIPERYQIQVVLLECAKVHKKEEKKISRVIRHGENVFYAYDHKVNQGETLASIANEYGVTANSISEWNGLDSNKIRVGQTLYIPSAYERIFEKNLGTVSALNHKVGPLLQSLADRINVRIGFQDIPTFNRQVSFNLEEGTLSKVLETVLPSLGLWYRITQFDDRLAQPNVAIEVYKKDDDEQDKSERNNNVLDVESIPIREKMEKKLGPISLRNADIKEVIQMVSDQTGVQIVLDPDVQGTITVKLNNPTVAELLRTILPPHGLDFIVLENGVIRVGKDDSGGDVYRHYDTELLKKYGIDSEDLEIFGFNAVAELGKGLVHLVAEKGALGQARVSLAQTYRCDLEFIDYRPPYLIVKGGLFQTTSEDSANTPLLENTLFLEKDKPALLGLTNMNQALILVMMRK